MKLFYLDTTTSRLFVTLMKVVTILLLCLLEFNVKLLSFRAVLVVDMSGAKPAYFVHLLRSVHCCGSFKDRWVPYVKRHIEGRCYSPVWDLPRVSQSSEMISTRRAMMGRMHTLSMGAFSRSITFQSQSKQKLRVRSGLISAPCIRPRQSN